MRRGTVVLRRCPWQATTCERTPHRVTARNTHQPCSLWLLPDVSCAPKSSRHLGGCGEHSVVDEERAFWVASVLDQLYGAGADRIDSEWVTFRCDSSRTPWSSAVGNAGRGGTGCPRRPRSTPSTVCGSVSSIGGEHQVEVEAGVQDGPALVLVRATSRSISSPPRHFRAPAAGTLSGVA